MLVAGLTGGLASGKSFVANALREMGCEVIEADLLGHETLQPGGPAEASVKAEFGPGILGEDGAIDRRKLGAIVFRDPAALARLNAIVHPAVKELAQARFREIERRDQKAVVVYAAAILVETGGYKEFAKLIVAACSRQQQLERAMARPGASLEDVQARLERQLPLEAKTAAADYVIDTGGTMEETLRQTRIVFEELGRLAS